MLTYTVFGMDVTDETGDNEIILLTAQAGGQENLPAEQVVPTATMAGNLARAAGGLGAGVTRCQVTRDGVTVGEFRFYRGWQAA